jgi:hypothetical protein
VLQPPSGATAGVERAMVECSRNSPQGVAILPQVAYLQQDSRLGDVGLKVLPVGAKPIAELNVSDPFAVGAFVAHGVPRALADGLAFPLAYSRHARVERFRHRHPLRPAG